MHPISLIQKALGNDWQKLPNELQQHYQYSTNADHGELTIEYPGAMQPYLLILAIFGALINRKGQNLDTTVSKHFRNDQQYWHRKICFPDGEHRQFNICWKHHKDNEIIEYTNQFIDLKMTVTVQGKQLIYEGNNIALNIGAWQLAIPENILLGHTTIIETATDNEHFQMDFTLCHPYFGQVYRYYGTFSTSKI